MKKATNIILLTILITTLASSTVSAHSGKTDANGGHTDSSTGEYHYHHGYSAHDHYDMDGDGDLDCPYEFKDNTDSDKSETDSTKQESVKDTTPAFIKFLNNSDGDPAILRISIVSYAVWFVLWHLIIKRFLSDSSLGSLGSFLIIVTIVFIAMLAISGIQLMFQDSQMIVPGLIFLGVIGFFVIATIRYFRK